RRLRISKAHQEDGNARPPFTTVGDINPTAVFLDNFANYSKTEPCSACLGCDIGLKYPAQHLRRKAWPVVGYGQPDCQMLGAVVGARLRALSLHINSGLYKRLVLACGIPRIRQQIMNDLAQLRYVAFDIWQVGIKLDMQAHALAIA